MSRLSDRFILIFVLFSLTGAYEQSAIAQLITPASDGTSTIITPVGNQINITGGQLSKDRANLFHSFERFGLNADQVANFLANPNLQNILGRVVGGEPSVINGKIQVTGGSANLYLMNPAGIIFGTTASLNVPASFHATTANSIGIGNQWFNTVGSNDYFNLVGNPDHFAFATIQPGAIINAGNLAVGSGQTLSLLGGTVISTGTITAPDGQIVISAVPGSNLVRIQQVGSLLSLEFPSLSSAQSPSASTPPSLPQLLTGGNLSNATGLTVNNAGQVVITSSAVKVPTDSGVAIASGKLDTSGQTGGSITVVGDRVGIVGATLNASGTQAGGTIRIGGDYQGKGTIPNASQTYVSQNSTIQANAIQQGNGGQVIVWADQSTVFNGNIQATGGVTSGDGGFVEVSGKQNLVFNGAADTKSPNGKLGTLLLDPENIFISTTESDPPGVEFALPNIFNSVFPGTDISISLTSLKNAANNNDIIVQADKNITFGNLEVFDSDSNTPGSQDRTGIQFTGIVGSITFRADANNDGIGDFIIDQIAPDGSQTLIQSIGRNIEIAGANISIGSIDTSSSNSNAGNITLKSTGTISTGSLVGIHAFSDPGNGATTTIEAGGEFILAGNIASFSQLNAAGNGGDINIKAGGDITLNCPASFCLESFAGTVGGLSSQNSGSITLESTNGKVHVLGANSPAIGSYNNGEGKAGVVRIIAKGDIITSRILAGDNSQSGGTIYLKSESGSINTTSGSSEFGSSNSGLLETGNSNGNNPPLNRSGGNITLDAYGDILTGNIDATGTEQGGTVTLISRTGTVNTAAGLIGSFSSTGGAGNITFDANSNLIIGNIDAKGQTGGGTTNLKGSNISFVGDQLTLGSVTGDPGTLVLNTPGTVQLPVNVSTNGASIIGSQPLLTLSGLPSGSTINTGGGNVTIPLATSFTLTPATSINTDGGDITITTPGALNINTPLNSGSSLRQGGTITLASVDALTVNSPLTTTSTIAKSGDIRLSSDKGTVFTTDLVTTGSSGGSVDVKAATEIKIGRINTNATNGDGGNVILDPPGNVEVAWINTQAPAGQGGFVDITTGRFFIASDTFTASNGLAASISTIGASGSGNITIRHDGGARFINFNIGDLLSAPFTNGTAGVITTGAFTLNLGESFPGPFTRGNIQLITSPRSAPIPEASPKGANGLKPEGTLFPPEERYTREFERHDGRPGETAILTLEQMQDILQQTEDNTGIKPALIYVGFVPVPGSNPANCEPGKSTPDPENPGKTKPCECIPVKLPDDPESWNKNVLEYEASPCDRLTLTLVTSKGKPFYVPLSQVPRHKILISANQFRKTIETKNSSFDTYQPLGNQLYQWLVKPLRTVLQEREIQNLSFLMPAQLRLLPLAALIDDDEKYLVETYSSGLMPSLSLVDTRKVEIKPTQILAMGASDFKADQEQSRLPYAVEEIQAITPDLWRGRLFINQDFIFTNLAIPRQMSPYGIVHFATHGQFNQTFPSGMIQLWDQKITPEEIRQLDWRKPPLELLVLSACQTAYGDRISELGFAGAASRIGVKSIIGSLWYVDDNGTKELMTRFYPQLKTAPIKADALAEAQKEMIKTQSFHHPFFWSSFTMVGNPW